MRRPRAPTPRNSKAGYVLVELMLAMVVMAMLAALSLPLVLPNRGSGAAHMKASEIAMLLRAARNDALRSGLTVTVTVDLKRRFIASPERRVSLPRALLLRMSPRQTDAVAFFSDGRATGGALVVGEGSAAYAVLVNPDTAAVEVAAQ